MDRFIWTQNLDENYAPKWPCPACGTGHLRLAQKPIPLFETRESREGRQRENWYEGDSEERFSCVLICDAAGCGEPVAVVGSAFYEEGYDTDNGQFWNRYLWPKFFHPPLKIMQIPQSCPVKVRAELTAALMLYWCHLGAAANRVRAAIELFLTHLKIARFGLRSGGRRRRRLTLHERIGIFRSKRPKLATLADAMFAVKWLGNEGSHPGSLTRDDLLDAFEIVEHLLNEILDTTRAGVQEIARAIIRARGPRSKTRRKKR